MKYRNIDNIWEEAKKIIPNGNHLLSKNPDLFLPGKWPAYYKKAKGCYIWDLNGKKYTDLCLMGVGTNILGYANTTIDREVIKSIKASNMSSLNSIEEFLLSKELIKMHPWFDMVRFARTGAEANAVAIRISRAFTNKDNVAVCGYHGWHDWYMAANFRKKKLDSHLFANLKTKGVVKNLKNTIFSFEYNDIEELKKIIKKKNIGTIFMEVSRSYKPKNNFLKKVRELAYKNNIVLIFDECSSGFRECLGGLHKKFNVKPDMAMFGKALGNGYAITAVLGTRNIMEKVKDTFISSTFWSERIGYVAGIAALKEMKKKKPWKKINKLGKYIKKKWSLIAKRNELSIEILGLDAMPSFIFNDKNHNLYKSYITQEFLKKNILASNVIYISTAHSKKIIDNYLKILNLIFKKIKIYKDKNHLEYLVKGKLAQVGMSRLN
jgi:glutamate-1-semialdehyde aminotransferase